MSDKLRWGILGTGFAAAQFAAGLRPLRNTAITAVASRSESRAQEFSRHFAIPTAYASYEELIASAEVDVVYVATLNPLHHAHCLLAIDSGKSVLCEKPFALDGSQAREVVQAARAGKVFCMEAIRPRFLPAVRRLHELVADGAIGTPLALYAALGHRSVVDPSNRLLDPVGGGALLDIGCYPLSIAVLLFGRPESVKSGVILDGSNVDHEWSALLKFADGRTATLAATLRADLSPSLLVTGSEGSIEMNGPLYWGERLTIRRHPLPPTRAVHTSTDFPPLDGPTRFKQRPAVRAALARLKALVHPLRRSDQVLVCRYPGNGFTAEAAEVMRCLEQGSLESPLAPLDDTVAMMDVMDAIRRQWSVN